MDSSLALSILICTRDHCPSLLETLDSLQTQSWPDSVTGHWDVLVVDNGSSDATFASACERAATFPVELRVVREEEAGLSLARNRALREARGRAVVFIDDDVTCQPGWLAAHARAFSIPEVVGVGGPIRPIMPLDTPEWFNEILESELGGPTSRYEFGDTARDIVKGGRIALPFGANMGVLREVALEVGGFRTDLGWGRVMVPSEELEFFRRVQDRGGRIVYSPDALLMHRVDPKRTSLEYYERWHRGFGRSEIRIDPPAHVVAQIASVTGSLLKLGYWQLHRILARGASKRMAALRSAERAKGRLAELLESADRTY